MLQFRIEKDNDLIDFNFPSTVDEITLKQYCEFEIKNDRIQFEFKDLELLPTIEKGQYLNDICELLSCFTNESLSNILDIPLKAKIDNSESLDIEGLESLFVFIADMVESYKPTKRKTFDYKDKTFTMPQMVVNRITGIEENPILSTGESILVYQYNHFLNANKGEKETIRVDLMFNRIRAMIAILCRQKGEKMPISDNQIDSFIDNRINFFKDVPFTVGIDISSFFFGTQKTLQAIHSHNGFLSHQTNQRQVTA